LKLGQLAIKYFKYYPTITLKTNASTLRCFDKLSTAQAQCVAGSARETKN